MERPSGIHSKKSSHKCVRQNKLLNRPLFSDVIIDYQREVSAHNYWPDQDDCSKHRNATLEMTRAVLFPEVTQICYGVEIDY